MQQAAEFAEMQSENARLKRELNQAKNGDFLEGLISQGRLAPIVRAQAQELLEFAEASDNGETLNFSEGESLAQKMRAFLSSLPQILTFSEVATKDRAAEPNQTADTQEYAENTPLAVMELDQKIRQHMRTHNTDYNTAFNAITGAK